VRLAAALTTARGFGARGDAALNEVVDADFSLIAGDDSRLAEIADAAIAAVTGQVELVE
jgi:hypothetical protein